MPKIVAFLFFIFPLFAAQEEILTTTEHTLETTNGPLEYKAITGFIHEENFQQKKMSFFYTAYFLKEEDSSRAITFCFNGGPGSSSVWLHMGAFGPKRFLTTEEGQKITPPYQWTVNEQTLLLDTDLVFIDPIGTGFSSTEKEEDLAHFCDTDKDVESIAEFIRIFLSSHKRWSSPKYLAGESYGTTRCCALSQHLHQQGICLNGLILISCAIDLPLLHSQSTHFLGDALRFPTYVATAWHYGKHAGENLSTMIELSKKFAMEEYFPALIQGSRLSEKSRQELIERLHQFTFLPKRVFQKKPLTVNLDQFALAILEEEGKSVGIYDTRISHYSFDKYWDFYSDPSIASIDGIFTGGFNAYLAEELQMSRLDPYFIFNDKINMQWKFPSQFGRGFSTFDSLQKSLEINPDLKIFVASGYFDAVTPFAATEYLFDQLQQPSENLEIHNYEGGHMLYLDRKAHKSFHRDLQKFYQKK